MIDANAKSNQHITSAFKSKMLKHSQINSSYDLQSEWTNYLSLLMAWPAIPIQLLTGLMAAFV
ncbi:hypothetical protein HWV03_08460 [Moritella sp. 36]|uniref:hypothetical protein n=1 Tax=Moritella sp. 36 TaxID=2746233 RepID=UPI001BA969CC|nr:hypothetical protein [Moritella sp. 36]QUM88828.1 hypothetical protein HWV03_08460 [Moritella sp. 36]